MKEYNLEALPLIYEDQYLSIYLQASSEYGKSVIFKIPKESQFAKYRTDKIDNEYEITRDTDIKGVRHAFNRIPIDGRYGSILEYIEGETIKSAFVINRTELKNILTIAISISSVLDELHRKKIVHGNISSDNIIVKQNETTIIDFGVSFNMEKKPVYFTGPQLPDVSLEYVSPEQTGRINRQVDFRTDLYSFGIVLYEMITGRLPFLTSDISELIYYQIAGSQIPVKDINDRIPSVLSDIIQKLLLKNPDDRYQSAYGLKRDLEECLRQLKAKDKIDQFELAKNDFFWMLKIPNELYGREKELKILSESIDKVQKKSQLIFITGGTGAGKTSVGLMIEKFVSEKNGFFLNGNFDIYQRDIPYSAIIQAFSNLIDQILADTSKPAAQWKIIINDALGDDAYLLADVIPKLDYVIGPGLQQRDIDPAEVQNMFTYMLSKFVNSICQAKPPLVIFLDNLQWSYQGSFDILKTMLTESKQNLLVIGSYRTDEVGPDHPLMDFVDSLYQLHINITNIKLENLTLNSLNQLVADSIKKSYSFTMSLSESIYGKTGGNPFFFIQYLKKIHDEKMLYFDFNKMDWVWQNARIDKMEVTDNIALLLEQKIDLLSDDSKNFLSAASCAGPFFDVDIMSEITDKTVKASFELLSQGLDQGIIRPVAGSGRWLDLIRAGKYTDVKRMFEFIHDRIRLSFYFMMPKRDRKATHLKIGRFFLKNTKISEIEQNIFTIVYHYNKGFQYVDSEQEKIRISELNLIAGRKATLEGAYKSAIWFLSMGTGILPKDKWERFPKLTLDMYMESISAEYLNGDNKRAELLSKEILQNISDLSTKITIYEIQIRFFTALNDNQKAINSGFKALNLSGIYLPSNTPEIKTYTEKIHDNLEEIGDICEVIIRLDEMKDVNEIKIAGILKNLSIPAYHINFSLLSMLIHEMIYRTIMYGNSVVSAFAYTFYGMLLCTVYNDIEKGYKLGISAKKLASCGAAESQIKVDYIFNLFIRHWKEHARMSLSPLLKISERGPDVGNLEYIYNSAIHYCGYLFLLGNYSLDDTYQKLSDSINKMSKFQFGFQSDLGNIWKQTIENLTIEYTENNLDLKGNILEISNSMTEWKDQNNYILLFHVCFCRTILLCIFCRYKESIESAISGLKYEEGGAGYIYLPNFYFFYALSLCGNYHSVNKEMQVSYSRTINEIIDKFKFWAINSPSNYRHKLYLIEAEYARVNNDKLKAMEYFSSAEKGARENGYLQDEALSYERESEFYLSLGRDDLAGICLKRASDGYRFWGAKRKVSLLEIRYSYLLSTVKPTPLDSIAVIKASHVLSQEIHLNKLLDKIIRIVIENAGAEKGILIRNKDGQLVIQAKGKIGLEYAETVKEIPVEESNEIPSSVVNYVARTRKNVVLDNAFHDSIYNSDDYISTYKIKSVMCLPIVHSGKLSGVLYLENNLTTRIFTPDRLELLQALSSQVAISIENATLYSNLENTIKDLRTTEERLRLTQFAVDQSGDAVHWIEKSGKFLYVNKTACDSLHYSSDELLSMRIQDIDPLVTPEMWETHWEELRRSGSLKFESLYRRKDGSVFPVEISENYIETDTKSFNFVFVRDITERKNAENILRENENFLNSIIENIPLMLFVKDAKTLNFLRFNKAGEQLLGYSRNELVGKNDHDFFPENEAEFFVKKDRNTLDNKVLLDIPEETILTKNSGIRTLHTKKIPMLDENGSPQFLLGISEDITDRKRAEYALKESEEKFRTLSETSSAAILVYRKKFLYVNPAAKTLTGHSKDELLKMNFSEIIHPEFRELVKQRGIARLHGENPPSHYEFKVIHKNGTTVWADLSSAVITFEGQRAGLGILIDITERKRSEEALRKYTEELARSNAELERFAYISSHDLQEPLRMITSFVQLLKKRYSEKLTPEADEYISYVVKGTHRMSQLINDLLAYSRISTRAQPLQLVDVNDVYNEVLYVLKLSINETQTKITHDPLPKVTADKTQMIQLFQNLIENAIKFRKENEVPKLHIGAEFKNGKWFFSVNDNGIGIDPKYFDRIFIIFQKLHSKDKYRGTGIGLAICKRIVERHKGNIWVKSTQGKGSTFYFTIDTDKEVV